MQKKTHTNMWFNSGRLHTEIDGIFFLLLVTMKELIDDLCIKRISNLFMFYFWLVINFRLDV